ncbi:glycerate kinase [Bordetella pertussis]|nr:glycerate kinase [Bordetella pertussis]
MAGATLVFTGEGRIDAQTLRGKTPAGVARMARDIMQLWVAAGRRML